MSVQYNNFKIILEKNEFMLETTKEEFMKDKILFIKCKEGHITENKNTSFINKCSSYQNKKIPSLCGKCNLRIPIIKKLEKRMNELNFKLIELDENNMDLIYQCGNCNNENKSNKNSMLKKNRTDFCPKCQNDKYKLEYEYIKNEFKKRNFLLLTKQDEYKSNKDLLNYVCSCGNQSKISLGDLKRERKCIFCKDERYKKTIIEKYGVPYMFQNEQIKEKIKETNIKKYGVEYPNQNPDIFKKGLQSSFKRKEYIDPFGRKYNILGYEDYVLDILFNNEKIEHLYAGDDENIPIFQYLDYNNKIHYYYPDIFIPSQNRIIEVKSDYTFEKEKEINMLKGLEVSNYYLFQIYIVSRKGEIQKIIEIRNGMIYSKEK